MSTRNSTKYMLVNVVLAVRKIKVKANVNANVKRKRKNVNVTVSVNAPLLIPRSVVWMEKTANATVRYVGKTFLDAT